jgi:MFS family permease
VSPLTRWLIITLAAIGFAFDIYEILVAPLIVRPALMELGGIAPGTPDFAYWSSLLIWVPAVSGGVFGLVGGYLTDYLGRRRVLTGSILLYAFSAFFAGFSTSLPMLLILRCTTFIGVCVEFVAAVAWLAELFTEPEQRERVLGFTQAFSSFGGLLVAVANHFIVINGADFPAISVPDFLHGMLGDVSTPFRHAPWRYTLMSGLLPAVPLILIRPFLPESPVWKQKKDAGKLKRPSILELFAPQFRRTTVVSTLMFACSYGAAFGAIQYIAQIVPGLADVREEVKHKTEHIPPANKQAVAREKSKVEQETAAEYTKMQEIGGLVGRFLLALLAVRIVSRRALLRCFQVPGILVLPAVFWFFLIVPNQHFFTIPLGDYVGSIPVTTVSLGVFLAGLVAVAQFSFWGNYLPRVYPVHLRGTGESFAANIGGRALGVGFWGVTSYLATQMPGATPPERITHAAAIVGAFVFVAGSVLCFFLPEPPREDIAD